MVYVYSTIKMMHGPANIKFTIYSRLWKQFRNNSKYFRSTSLKYNSNINSGHAGNVT